jgi:hypothetical protein
MDPNMLVYLATPNRQKWAYNLKSNLADLTDCDLAHPRETSNSAPTKQIDKERLDKIIRVMTEKDCVTTPAPRDFREELVPRCATSGLGRNLFLSCEGGNIHGIQFKLKAASLSEFLDETSISGAFSAAQPMIEMADDEPLVAAINKLMKQSHRIATAGDANQIFFLRRKLPKNFEVELEWIPSRRGQVLGGCRMMSGHSI